MIGRRFLLTGLTLMAGAFVIRGAAAARHWTLVVLGGSVTDTHPHQMAERVTGLHREVFVSMVSHKIQYLPNR